MRNILIKLAVSLAGVLSFAAAQASSIGGQIEIQSGGTFQVCTSSSTCTNATSSTAATTVNGFDFGSNGMGTDGLGETGNTGLGQPLPTGDIYDMMAAAGDSFPFDFPLSDVNLFGVPPSTLTEWTISPVQLASGAQGDLVFVITSGKAVDTGSGAGFFDLEGSGYFQVINCPACVASDTIDKTGGRWSISNTSGSTSVVLHNVPAPATIGILGIALLGLGFIRRRRAAA